MKLKKGLSHTDKTKIQMNLNYLSKLLSFIIELVLNLSYLIPVCILYGYISLS